MKFDVNLLKIIPYVSMDGINTLPDSYIKGIYHKLIEDDLFGIYHFGRDTDTFKDYHFLNYAKQNTFIVVEYDNKLGGFCSLQDFSYKVAFINYCTFKWAWGIRDGEKRLTQWGCNQALRYIFNFYETLLAVAPVDNEISFMFAKEMGFKEIGEIAHICYKKNINKFNKAIFMELNREKFNYV